MNGSPLPLDAMRQTLECLLQDEDATLAKLSRIRHGIEAITDYLPEAERGPYLRWLDLPNVEEGVEELTVYPVRSRFPPNTTMADAAETVLKHIGRRMKSRELVTTLRAWGFPYEKDDDAFHASLGGILARKAGMGEVFTKPEPGTFGLVAWEEEDDRMEEPDDIPPPDFGDEDEEDTNVAVRAGQDYDDFQPPPFGDDDDDDLPF